MSKTPIGDYLKKALVERIDGDSLRGNSMMIFVSDWLLIRWLEEEGCPKPASLDNSKVHSEYTWRPDCTYVSRVTGERRPVAVGVYLMSSLDGDTVYFAAGMGLNSSWLGIA